MRTPGKFRVVKGGLGGLTLLERELKKDDLYIFVFIVAEKSLNSKVIAHFYKAIKQ